MTKDPKTVGAGRCIFTFYEAKYPEAISIIGARLHRNFRAPCPEAFAEP
jgi:hypothetical protein